MIHTSTQVLDFTEEKNKQAGQDHLPDFDSPSLQSISNILNYSRNLDVKKSKFVKDIEYIRS
jgi:hypothetical protein